MAVSVQMPALGESVTEGTVTRWLKQEGDTVEVDEPLLEVSTDKVDTEILPGVGCADQDHRAGGRHRRGRRRVGAHRRAGEALQTSSDSSPAPAEQEKPAEEPGRPKRSSSPNPGGTGAEAKPAAAVVRFLDAGEDARTRRIRHRGHRHPLAEEGRRHRRDRRSPGRGLHRQGRHRDPSPVAGTLLSITAEEDVTVPVGGSWAASVTRARRRRPSPNRSRAQAEAEAKPEPKPEPVAEAKPESKPEPEPCRCPRRSRNPPRAPGAERRQPVCDPAGAKVGCRERNRPRQPQGHRRRRPHPQAGRAGRGGGEEGPGGTRRSTLGPAVPAASAPAPAVAARRRWPTCAAPRRRRTGSGSSRRRRRASRCRPPLS